MRNRRLWIGLLGIVLVVSCDKQEKITPTPDEDTKTLTVSKERIVFPEEGGYTDFEIETDAENWVISMTTETDWLELSHEAGGTGITDVVITAARNPSTSLRSAILEIVAGDSLRKEISITQSESLYPGYNINPLDPDTTGMNSTATEIADKILLGWNSGNTLEAIGGETAWGNPKITRELIQLVKQNGFNAIRLPCSWDQYTNQTSAEINQNWLDRVKEVVQICVDNDLYVLLNIHWDGGWLENNCTPDKQYENNAKQRALWEQIATHLREFDEHLLFAGANEPNVDNTEQMNVLLSYHQTFIDAVRSTGGKNANRVLVIQGPSTDIEKTNRLMSSLPADDVTDKLMVEIHYYTPYQFCLMEEDAGWGKMFYYWGTDYHSATDTERNADWGEESTVDELMGLMHTKFVSQGIPVILGEYAVGRRLSLTGDELDLHLASRAYYLEYVTRAAKANGILPFYWDAGGLGNMGSGIFNRDSNTIFDQQALEGLVKGATE